MNAALASLALFGASAVAGSYGFSATNVGSAHVVNHCTYPVNLCNVPSSDGGHQQEDRTLSPGESWEQSWTALSNGNGWSIKLSKSHNMQSNILQYEYTFHNDGIIWYDLSCVDGNPWDQDWEITANGTDCSPKQQAYRYSTDDAYGMQSCSQDTAITVTLCTGLSADNGNAVNASSQPAQPKPSASAPSNTPAASYENDSGAASAPAATTQGYKWNNKDKDSANPGAAPASTDDVVMTEVETVYDTAKVTAYAKRFRRHDHVQHQHQRQRQRQRHN